MNCKPAINFIQNSFHTSSAMEMFKVLRHPTNKVVFEDTLDYLME